MVVWQWCLGVPEKQGNLMALSDAWWCPYLPDANAEVEHAFSAAADELDLTLPVIGRRVKVVFTRDAAFAVQLDEARGKERAVRRVIKTVQDVKVMIDRMSTPPLDLSELAAALPTDTFPHHFFCPISQDVMADPVKTIDNHTYDRSSIERWFQHNTTSPLTGLRLASIALVPHHALRLQIEEFARTLSPEQRRAAGIDDSWMAATAAAAAAVVAEATAIH